MTSPCHLTAPPFAPYPPPFFTVVVWSLSSFCLRRRSSSWLRRSSRSYSCFRFRSSASLSLILTSHIRRAWAGLSRRVSLLVDSPHPPSLRLVKRDSGRDEGGRL